MGKKVKVMIIGLGNIAYKYDLNLPNDYILSHLRAFEQHLKFKVIGVVDKSKKAIKFFSDNFNHKTR